MDLKYYPVRVLAILSQYYRIADYSSHTDMTPVDSYNSQGNYSELVKGVGLNKNLGTTDE